MARDSTVYLVDRFGLALLIPDPQGTTGSRHRHVGGSIRAVPFSRMYCTSACLLWTGHYVENGSRDGAYHRLTGLVACVSAPYDEALVPIRRRSMLAGVAVMVTSGAAAAVQAAGFLGESLGEMQTKYGFGLQAAACPCLLGKSCRCRLLTPPHAPLCCLYVVFVLWPLHIAPQSVAAMPSSCAELSGWPLLQV